MLKIIADSSCDLSLSYLQENDVILLPLSVELDGKTYADRVEMKPEEIFPAMEKGGQPKTSQVSPDKFLDLFTELAKNDEAGIYFPIASELSGTYSTACMIRDQVLETYPNLNLTIVDTKSVSLGLGLLVKAAVDLKNEGKSMDEIEAIILEKSTRMEHLFTVGNLEYLARGGRISKTSAVVGGLLNIKPILNVDATGKLEAIDKVRGHKKSITRIIDLMEQRGHNLVNQKIGIIHSYVPDFAKEVQTAIEARFTPVGFEVYEIGAVIGSHVGPGTIGLFFESEDRVKNQQ